MGAVTVMAYDGQFDEAAFSLLPALAGKNLCRSPKRRWHRNRDGFNTWRKDLHGKAF
jgi:hypothetical protein